MSDSTRYRRICDMFEACLELSSEERRALLDRECNGDDELRRSVERMLRQDADSTGDGFAESAIECRRAFLSSIFEAEAVHPGEIEPIGDLPSRISHYRIIRKIGEGGMGSVFEAKQDNPRRTVAPPRTEMRHSPVITLRAERHLRRILSSYFAYYHESRTHHLSLDRNSPIPREVELPERGKVIAIPQVGGLHHRYRRACP